MLNATAQELSSSVINWSLVVITRLAAVKPVDADDHVDELLGQVDVALLQRPRADGPAAQGQGRGDDRLAAVGAGGVHVAARRPKAQRVGEGGDRDLAERAGLAVGERTGDLAVGADRRSR